MTKKITVDDVELGQLLFHRDSILEYEVPLFVEALLSYIREEVQRIYWNINQKELNLETDEWVEKEFAFRPYDWNFDVESEKRDSQVSNIEFDGVKINFYKHFWRSMTSNIDKSKVQWIKWFEKFNKVLSKLEKNNLKY